jgi:serine/threonine protein kinase
VEKEQREFRVDPLKLRRLRVQFGLTIEKFWEAAIMDSGTAKKLFKGGPASLTTIVKAAKVFGIVNHLELLHPDELLALGVDPDVPQSPRQVLEWEEEPLRLTAWERTANGLQYQVAKLRHRFLKDRFARGKCYELRHLPSAERRKLEEQLIRHPSVCERLRKHPNIAENLSAAFVEQGGLWWVLDRFEEGPTLKERLQEGPLELSDLKKVMLGIAEGLQALHGAKIIRRELAPRFIILRAKDGSPVLTDFELAKLLEGRPTVAPKGGWPDDPYRAAEVAGEGTVDERADVYSWGRIFTEAAVGSLPAKGQEIKVLKKAELPDSIRELVQRTVALPRSDRPKGLDEILKAMRRWRV